MESDKIIVEESNKDTLFLFIVLSILISLIFIILTIFISALSSIYFIVLFRDIFFFRFFGSFSFIIYDEKIEVQSHSKIKRIYWTDFDIINFKVKEPKTWLLVEVSRVKTIFYLIL